MKGATKAGPQPAAPPTQDAAATERQRLNQIVHDLNTPLSAVSLQLFLRRRSLVKPTPQELHFLEILDRNVARIRTLVASLMPERGG
ncbi:MAG: histidine kinase dimerization/phospho-acceptor domain-containing protein [Candidatus Thermoplasmatota archaeon]